MTKLLKKLLVILCVFIVSKAAAQPATVYLRVRHFYSDYWDDNAYNSIFRFYKTQVDDRHKLVNGCLKRDVNFGPSDEYQWLYPVYLNDVRDGFNLIMVTHCERQAGSSDC